MIAAGICDAAVVGGVDSLCLMTLYGFHSLGLTAPGRAGLMTWIGTGSRLAREGVSPSSRKQIGSNPGAILLLGVGESSDAYAHVHASSRGAGARMPCSRLWIRRGSSLPTSITSNLHGTATKEQRCERRQGGIRGFRAGDALQLDQGRDRAPARGGRITEAIVCILAIGMADAGQCGTHEASIPP